MIDDTARRLAEIRQRCDEATPGEWVMWAIPSAFPERYQVYAPAADNINVVQSGIGVSNGVFVANARADIPYLLDLVASRDKELIELRGMLTDLCEDSRAAAAALRYRQALERLATVPPFGGRGDDWDELCPEVRRIANEALKGEPP